MEIADLYIHDNNTIIEALRQLSRTAKGILFVVDEKNVLEATLTDGDIRRFILADGDFNSSIDKAANYDPKIAFNIDEAKVLFEPRGYHAIPIVDDAGKIVDIYMGEAAVHFDKLPKLHVPVVVNAGGKGTRLDPYTKVLPKPLIPVGDLPILEHIFREFINFSCEDFHVIINYKKEIMKAYFAENNKKYNITWYDEEKPLGTGGGLSLLKGAINETFIFTNCDILLKINYGDLLKYHKEHNNLITMVCVNKTVAIPYGVVDMSGDGDIDGFREKPEFSFLTNTGLYIVEPEVLEYIEDNVSIGFPDVIEKLRLQGKKVSVYSVSEHDWYDMGQLPDLERMRKRLSER